MAGQLEYDKTPGSNTTINGIGIQGTDKVLNFDNALRQMMGDAASAITRVVDKSGNYTALKADFNQMIRATANMTLALTAAATLTSGWCIWVKADGGNVTVDPAGSEKINGAATQTIADGTWAFIVCTSTGFVSIGTDALDLEIPDIDGLQAALDAKADTDDLAAVATSGSYNDLTDKPVTAPPANKIIMRVGDDYEPPDGLAFIFVQLIGGGGGGGGGAAGASPAGTGGTSGGGSIKIIMAGDLEPVEAVLIGAGGAGGAANGAKGGNGGTTSFGAHFSATGGGGGKGSASGTTGDPGIGVDGDINMLGFLPDGTRGGQSVLGSAGGYSTGSNTVGIAALPHTGAGGGAGVGAGPGGSNRAGGAGGSGLCIIEEYF